MKLGSQLIHDLAAKRKELESPEKNVKIAQNMIA
jgi:hypothetical protein